MPIYEYACSSCEKITEALRSMDAADEPIECGHCGFNTSQRVHSVFSAGASENISANMSLPTGSCGTCGNPGGSCGMG
ncbi:MAG: FmdB family transcriptional regulator [Phycisphaeraceae bacterium]|nr:FmdB family transcriptional regulator [Phycisphaeraceae bacterium]